MKAQTQFFNEISERWDSMCHHDNLKLRYLLGRVSMQPGDRVLDVGTGTGVLIPYIREINPGGDIRAIDLSPGMLRIAARKFSSDPHLKFRIEDVETSDIPGRYRHILLYSVFPHLENREETIWRLVSHNLSDNGFLLIAHSQSREELNRMHRRRNESVSEDMLIDVGEQKLRLQKYGLKVIEACESSDLYYLLVTR